MADKGAVESVLDFVENRRKRLEDEKRQKEEAEAAAAKAAEAAAKAEAERARIRNEKTARFIGKHWKVLLAAVVALVLIISIGLLIQPKDQAEANTATMPESAAALKGGNYQDVKTKLQAAGFTSIETSAMPDLVVGWLKKYGEVEEVSVNGGTDFSDGSRFPKSARIVIRYHTFPEPEPDQATGSAQATESAQAAESTPTEIETPKSVPKELSKTILTTKNSPEFRAILKTDDSADPRIVAFIQKYAGRTIEFDGNTWDWFEDTGTTIMWAGDFEGPNAVADGPTFRVEGFHMPDSSSPPARKNVHVKAIVDGWDEDHTWFRITLTSMEAR